MLYLLFCVQLPFGVQSAAAPRARFSASFIQTSHVKLKEQTWRKNKEFVEFCFFEVALTGIICSSTRLCFDFT